MMRRMPFSVAWGLALALAVLLQLPVAASAKIVERVVAVVNQQILLLSELNERLQPLLPQLQQVQDPAMRKQRLAELQRQMLEMMIDEELIEQQARELQIAVSEEDLERAIADVMRKNNLTREQLEAALQQEGKTIEGYKRQILKPQLLRLRVLNIRVRSRIAVSDDEIQAQYQKNLRQLGVETKVRARHIFVAIPSGASEAVRAERERQIRELLAKIEGGQSFEEVAKRFSEDPVTRPDGGDLGYFARGALPTQVENVVFAMKAGEVRGPILGERGYHLIELVDRQESAARSLSEVKEELREQLYMEKMESATKAWLAELRKRSYLEIKL